MLRKPLIALTLGSPSGIGAEVAVKASSSASIKEISIPILVGNNENIELLPHPLKKKIKLNVISNFKEAIPQRDKLNFLPVNGTPLEFLKVVVRAALKKEISGIVTAPVSKSELSTFGEKFTGHTEYLAKLTQSKHVVMLLVSRKVKVGLVTHHIPIKEIVTHLTQEKIYQTIRRLALDLKKYFGISQPRVAVLGLNPHAGEEGLLGVEEKRVIIPAIERARRSGFLVEGPFPGDSAFLPKTRAKFDCFLAMYHDQGLLPVKLLDFNKAVNLTLGLPFIRTAPAHGTAPNMKGRASSKSTEEAIKLVVNILKKSS
jgi:4-hydroxythreonine-4-phosphate dehydrogenase